MREVKRQAKAWLADERGTLHSEGRFHVALCYPNTYGVAHASLGFQLIYRAFNDRPDFACERAVHPGDEEAWAASRTPLLTIERQRPVGGFDLIAFTFAFELDLTRFIQMLERSGLPALASERGPEHPPVIVGGPVTLSNPLPLGPFADVVILGDGEVAVSQLMDALEESANKEALLEAVSPLPGFWVPAIHGDRTPDTLKVGVEHLPAVGQIVTPHSELSNMFLIETSRGCPRMCTFCVVRATASPMREADPRQVLDAIPDWAPRVGYVGAAVSDYRHIHEVLAGALEKGKEIGVSSLRADRLDEEMVQLLHRGGYRTMTVAADAPSERQREKLMKGIRERHLVRAAELAHWVGFRRMKLYMIVGLPGETESDLADLIRLCRELAKITSLAITLSPFVPKLHTPLAAAPFEGVKSIERKLRYIRRELGGQVDVRGASARWAWVEYALSQGGMDSGLAALKIARQGAPNYAAWRHGLSELTEPRAALQAAERHGVWVPTGVDKTKPRPPRPPKRLPWKGVKPVV